MKFLNQFMTKINKIMKKVLKYSSSILLLISFLSCNQFDNLVKPSSDSNEKIAKIITESYPEATELDVSILEKNTLWKADFKINNDKYSSILNENSYFLETLKNLKGLEILPERAQNYVLNKYENYNVKNTFANINGKTLLGYKIILSQNSQNQILMFDNEGYNLIELTNFLTATSTNLSGTNTSTIAYSYTTDPINLIVVDFNSLPKNIQDYFKDGSQGEVISAAIYVNSKDKGYVVVTKKSDKKIQHLFDKNGVFITNNETSGGINIVPIPTKDTPNNDIVGENITKENIPSKIKEYLNKYFSGWSFLKGYLKRIKGGDVLNYDIVISLGKDQTYILSFDKNQDIIKKELVNNGSSTLVKTNIITENMILQNIPSKIKDAVTVQFGQWTYIKGLIQKTKDGLIISYDLVIELVSDKKTYYLTYDANFKLIKKELFGQTNSPATNKVISTELLTISNLPSKIKDLLNKKHSSWNLEKALLGKDEKGNIIDYIVAITVDGKLIYYTFDKNMDLILSNNSGGTPEANTSFSILESNLPANIRATLDTKFAGWVFGSAFGLYDSKKQIVSYKVIIGVGTIKYSVLFDKDFKFLSFSKLS